MFLPTESLLILRRTHLDYRMGLVHLDPHATTANPVCGLRCSLVSLWAPQPVGSMAVRRVRSADSRTTGDGGVIGSPPPWALTPGTEGKKGPALKDVAARNTLALGLQWPVFG